MHALDKKSTKPLYEQLYELLRDDILSGRIGEGKKLPSKRSLADQLRISTITVENAYSQLIAEGYVRSAQRSGYFVQYSGGAVKLPERGPRGLPKCPVDKPNETTEQTPQQSAGAELFPFSVWSRLMRSVISERGTRLLQPVKNGGAPELREAISG